MLHVLRNGLDVIGQVQALALCQFKPAPPTSKVLRSRYAANRLRVVRQVRYSLRGGDCLDLVLFLNGIPVATAQLKSGDLQSAEDAVDQYRRDRLPEPLLSFPGGAIVHFAVSDSEVRMSTRLRGSDSVFLPFDRGDGCAAGNPPNPCGARTAYLWEDVWQTDSWLEILGRYVLSKTNAKNQLTNWTFPRFHQLAATRKLAAAALRDGPGGRYLIQHSAGSGKTNSIAWTARLMAELHDAKNAKVFDAVVVVSDRALDDQLRKGVVAPLGGDAGVDLANALATGARVVVCAVQTFPSAVEELRKLAAATGKRFAVIADEARSSPAGIDLGRLKLDLTPEEIADLEDGGEVGIEDLLAAGMTSSAGQDASVTFIAFAATPKLRTLELFGTRPEAGDGSPCALHVYSMRQAIEEGFILDVLKNYTSCLHSPDLAARVRVTVEHFRRNVAHLLGGRSKAVVVAAGRKEAALWATAMSAYIHDKKYPIRLLVAFPGEVPDEEAGPDACTAANMHPDLKGRSVREAFDTDDYSILVATGTLATALDQPMLCAMYVDRKLGGVQAVQTLSPLNRAYRDGTSVKDATYVVDFVNKPADVLEAFRQHHATAQVETRQRRSAREGMGPGAPA